jgi:hypothetical protein
MHRPTLEEMIHARGFQNKLSIYIDILETQGTEQAHQQFPEIVSHLEECEVCRIVVEDTQFLLHDMEEREHATSSRVKGMQPAQEDREAKAKPLSDEFLRALVAELNNDDISRASRDSEGGSRSD